MIAAVLALSGCAGFIPAKKTESALSDFNGNNFGDLSQGLNIFEGTLSGICFATETEGFSNCPESDFSDTFRFSVPAGFESVSAVVTTDNAGLGRHMGVDMPELGVPSGLSTNFFTALEFGTSENVIRTENLIFGSVAIMEGGERYQVRMHFRPTIPPGTHTVNWRLVINLQPSEVAPL